MEKSWSPRDRILSAAAALLADGGREAVSTRAVSAAAGVQAPTIYRQFGDMKGLLDEVASHGFATYVGSKTGREHVDDPVEDLRLGWDLHVEFGLTNPALYTLMYGDPTPGSVPAAAREAAEVLHQLVQRTAEAGRLRVSVDLAVRMIQATGVGVVLVLIGAAPEDRDSALSAATREAVLAALTTSAPLHTAAEPAGPQRASSRAVTLKAVLPEATGVFTPAEQELLSEWLDRLSQPTHRHPLPSLIDEPQRGRQCQETEREQP